MERVLPDGHCRGCGALDLDRRDCFFLCDRCLAERLGQGQPPAWGELDHQRALGELRARWLGRDPEQR